MNDKLLAEINKFCEENSGELPWTDEILETITIMYKKLTCVKIAEFLNKQFKTEFTKKQISNKVTSLGLRKGG